MTPYATLAQLETFWKDIASADEPRAEMLLELASNRLRMIGEDVEVDVDAKVAASPAYASTAQWVVMEATKRAMLTPIDLPPVDTFQQTAGPYSENIKYTNPSGDLWFKKSELASLGLYGRQTLSSLNTSQNLYYNIYSS
jgi:Phage protein Gp19/Gp15/Gp42